MKPTTFPEANGTLYGGESEKFGTWSDVANLPVHRTTKWHEEVISCWRPSLVERLSIVVFGRVWLRVAGLTSPPVSLQGKRSVFEPAQEETP